MTIPSELRILLAAQAMLPVLNRTEMRGVAGDRNVAGGPNELEPLRNVELTAPYFYSGER